MVLGTAALVPAGGLLLGAAFGALVQRSHFCTMGCVSDAVLFGSFRRARIWALALATALLGSQALELGGAVDLAASAYRAPSLFWLGALLGGLLFGFGMVLAGGCVGRNLARLGAGSLKALATLLVLAGTAQATLAGALAPLAAGLRAVGTLPLGGGGAGGGGDSGAPALLAAALGVAPAPVAAALTLAAAAALLGFVLKDAAFRRAGEEAATGVLLGLLVPLGWLLTGWLAGGEPQSLTFVAPVGSGLLFLMTGRGGTAGFGIALVGGTLLGAALVAGARRQLRLETFAGRGDTLRHLAGGAMMGVGGALALGCTVGQGLTGAATLGVGSLLALGSILAGGVWGVRYLETGRILPPAAPRAGASGRLGRLGRPNG